MRGRSGEGGGGGEGVAAAGGGGGFEAVADSECDWDEVLAVVWMTGVAPRKMRRFEEWALSVCLTLDFLHLWDDRWTCNTVMRHICQKTQYKILVSKTIRLEKWVAGASLY